MVQRTPLEDFEPQFRLPVDLFLTELQDNVDVEVRLANAASIPAGTRVSWTWDMSDDSVVSTGALRPMSRNRGVRGTLHVESVGDASIGIQLVLENDEGMFFYDVEPQIEVGVLEPDISIEYTVEPGLYGSEGADLESLKQGDTAVIRQTFGHVVNPASYEVEGDIMHILLQQNRTIEWENIPEEIRPEVGSPDDSAFEFVESVWEGHTLLTRVSAHHAGQASLGMFSELPGAMPTQDTLRLASVATGEQFLRRCNEATNRHRALVAVADSYLNRCFLNYQQAHENVQQALSDDRERAELATSILLGALFAAVGGFAGGAVVKGWAEKWAAQRVAGLAIRQSLRNAVGGGITDAIKDLTKFTARLPTRLRGDGSSSGGGPSAEPAGPDAESASAEIDPLTWYHSLDGKLAQEESTVALEIQSWQNAVGRALDRGEEVEADWDPVDAVNEVTSFGGTSVDSLEIPAPEEYERSMWQLWFLESGYRTREEDLESRVVLWDIYGQKMDIDPELLDPESVWITSGGGGSSTAAAQSRVAARLQELGIEPDDSWISEARRAGQARALAEAREEKRRQLEERRNEPEWGPD